MAGLDDNKLELARRELARRKLVRFCQYVMPTYKPKPHHEAICAAVDLVVDEVVPNLIINVPPQHGKSEAVSRKCPPYALGKHPDWRVVLASYNAALAYSLSREARNTIETDEYKQLFGPDSNATEVVELSEDTRSVASWNLKGKRGGMLAAGVGGGITGHSADLFIIDDPVKDDVEVQDEKFRDEQYQWFWSVVASRSPKGVVLCQTRWHEDDLTGRLLRLQEESGMLWYVLRLTAVAETEYERALWCEKNHVRPEFMLTLSNMQTLRSLLPEERPHKLWSKTLLDETPENQ